MTPLEKVLDATRSLGPQEPQSDGSFMIVCPAHADTNPSLHVSADHTGKIALNCFKQCNHRAICYAMGMTVSELFPDHGQRGDNSGRPARKKSKARDQIRGKKKVAEFDYRDADGILVYQAVRYEDEAGKKTFIQRRPNGQGGFVLNMNGVTRVLYRLPELIATPKDQIVYILEGERKTETLRKWGLTATCNVGGAGKWLKEYSKYFRGRRVIILPDNDPVDPKTGLRPGYDHARKIVASLEGESSWTRVLILPGLPAKGDIDDWVAEGGNLPKFLELVKRLDDGSDGDLDNGDSGNSNSAPFDGNSSNTAPLKNRLAGDYQSQSLKALDKQPDPTAVATLVSSSVEESLLASIRLEVLGEIEGSGGKVKVFSEDHRKTDIISDVGKLSYERLLQVCGPAVKKSVHQGQDDVPGVFTLKDVKQAIAVVSGFRRVGDDNESGQGMWRGINDNREPNNSVILVGSGEAAKWNGDKTLHRIIKPRSDGRILDLGSPKVWYQHQELSELCQKAGDRDWCIAVIREAEDLFSRWAWRSQNESPAVIVGLIMASFMQTLWLWRPQVAIIGESNTGKSTLFGTLAEIFGNLTIKSSSSSAAGIRQAIQISAVIALCDEFESGKYRQEILDMIRASSRGDTILRGTTGHKGKEFTLRHIVWIAAIESGLQREPDRNRFITLELVPPAADQMGKLSIPPAAVLHLLGQKLLAITIRHAITAVNLAVDLKQVQIEGVHSRVIESYSAPAAILATAYGFDNDGAMSTLGTLLKTAERLELSHGDKEQLLEDILSSKLDIGRGEKASVSQAMAWRPEKSEYDHVMEQHGIGIFDEGVFFAHNLVVRHLLKGTKWESQNIDQILIRIRGAEKVKRRICGGTRPWGILLPRDTPGLTGINGTTSPGEC